MTAAARRRGSVPTPDEPVQLLTLRQAAERLGCSRDSVERWIASGELTAVDLRAAGKRAQLRIPEASLRAFVDRRTIAVAPARPRAVPPP